MASTSPHPPLGSTLVTCCGALAATAGRLVRPRRADRRLLATLGDAGLPPTRATVRLTALPQARQSAPAAVVAEGARRPRRLRLSMTTFLVEHPRARFLVDPAMCTDVHDVVLPELSPVLRAAIAPEKPVAGLAEVLATENLDPADIDFALPTHLHWDHVSGLLELPHELPVRTLAVERDWALAGPVAPHGVARGPLLSRHFDPFELDGPPVLTFTGSHDLFGDGSAVLVDLAGHTPGSVGVLLAVDGGDRVLLAGDAVWHGLQVTLVRGTAPFPGRFTDADRAAAFATVHRLHALPASIEVVASHDRAAAAKWAHRDDFA
ncbi:MBL fold metallo-hydrolase [Pseudonocardia spinosispora]|uniref:MBL fold metallo-hydrolase n=1 Tax=Pseudonocardia spinosispora TaxID=103441 RepID=UPI000685C194|nr:MBL fold metallo-hydrolase [Pseudonocardia spinosispora]